MKTWITVVALWALGVTVSNAAINAEANGHGIDVHEVAVGTAIDNKDLTGKAAEYPSTVERVYCWMKVSADAPATMKHVWYAEGKKEAEVSLQMKSAVTGTRIWSSKRVWPGQWKVEVLGPSDQVFATEEFLVQK